MLIEDSLTCCADCGSNSRYPYRHFGSFVLPASWMLHTGCYRSSRIIGRIDTADPINRSIIEGAANYPGRSNGAKAFGHDRTVASRLESLRKKRRYSFSGQHGHDCVSSVGSIAY